VTGFIFRTAAILAYMILPGSYLVYIGVSFLGSLILAVGLSTLITEGIQTYSRRMNPNLVVLSLSGNKAALLIGQILGSIGATLVLWGFGSLFLTPWMLPIIWSPTYAYTGFLHWSRAINAWKQRNDTPEPS